VPNNVAKGKLMQATLAGRSLAEMQDWTARWLAQDFPGQLREDAMARLAWHREAGHCCVMVSASPDIYLPQVARQLGFDALICTEMEVKARARAVASPAACARRTAMASRRCCGFRPGRWRGLVLPALEGRDSVCLWGYFGDKPMLRLARHAWYRGEPWGERAPV
jgi:phosphatidylglycerophosphatase C